METFMEMVGVICITIFSVLIITMICIFPVAVLVGYVDIFKWLFGH